MPYTTWRERLEAPTNVQLVLDSLDEGQEQQHRAQMEQLEAILEQSARTDAVARGVGSLSVVVDQGLAGLGALFDWRLEQIRAQLQWQSNQLQSIFNVLSHPMETQAREAWERAQHASTRGWTDEAISFYQEAIAKSPFLYLAHLQLGTLYAYRVGDTEHAVESLRLAARYSVPDDPKNAALALYNLHAVQRGIAGYESAWESIDRAIELDPGLLTAWWDRATLAVVLGKTEELTSSLRKAIAMDPLYWHRANIEPIWGIAKSHVDFLLSELLASANAAADLDMLTAKQRIADARSEVARLPSPYQVKADPLAEKYLDSLSRIASSVDRSNYLAVLDSPQRVGQLLGQAHAGFSAPLGLAILDEERAGESLENRIRNDRAKLQSEKNDYLQGTNDREVLAAIATPFWNPLQISKLVGALVLSALLLLRHGNLSIGRLFWFSVLTLVFWGLLDFVPSLVVAAVGGYRTGSLPSPSHKGLQDARYQFALRVDGRLRERERLYAAERTQHDEKLRYLMTQSASLKNIFAESQVRPKL